MAAASSDERKLHQRLIDRDETAPADVFVRYLDALIAVLSRYHPGEVRRDKTLISDAVTEALFKYIDKPARYDPDRKCLGDYLRMSAEGDLKNLQAKERRMTQGKESLEALVELRPEIWNSSVEAFSNPEQDLTEHELNERLRRLFPDEKDVEVVQMMLDGIRKTIFYADVLGIGHLPVDEQRTEVKRVKDRLTKVLRRADWGDFKDPGE